MPSELAVPWRSRMHEFVSDAPVLWGMRYWSMRYLRRRARPCVPCTASCSGCRSPKNAPPFWNHAHVSAIRNGTSTWGFTALPEAWVGMGATGTVDDGRVGGRGSGSGRSSLYRPKGWRSCFCSPGGSFLIRNLLAICLSHPFTIPSRKHFFF